MLGRPLQCRLVGLHNADSVCCVRTTSFRLYAQILRSVAKHGMSALEEVEGSDLLSMSTVGAHGSPVWE